MALEGHPRRGQEPIMRITKKGLTIHTAFDRWGEFVEQAEMLVTRPRGSSSHEPGKWAGTETFDEAISLAKYGWAEGAKQIKSRLDVMTENLPTQSVVKELTYAQAGPGMLNMGRYIMGHPRPYQVWKDTESTSKGDNGRVVKVVYNGSVSGVVNHEVIKNKGILTCALLDTLEHLGYRTELVVAFCTKARPSEKCTNTIEIMVKHPDDWLDIDKIAFACAHPSTLRRLGFSIWEQQPANIVKHYNIGGNYGCPTAIPHLQDGTVYVPELHAGEAPTPEAQMELIRTALEKVGVTFDN
jgi:hypothetical protein